MDVTMIQVHPRQDGKPLGLARAYQEQVVDLYDTYGCRSNVRIFQAKVPRGLDADDKVVMALFIVTIVTDRSVSKGYLFYCDKEDIVYDEKSAAVSRKSRN